MSNNQLTTQENNFPSAAPVIQAGGHSTAVEATRAAQEVQARMVVAKRFPRDENTSYDKIMTMCKRQRLAESALYSYPRGGQTVKGPSIHLAKAIAKAWGNLDFGIRLLESEDGNSKIETFCWDMESNVRETRVFDVAHERHTKKGVTTLTDPRDIYEMQANMGSRRLRACILGIIPEDLVDAAVEQCYKTMAKGGGDKPLADRIREMAAYFSSIGVTKKMLEKRLGHNLDAIDETELVDLRMIANSLKNGAAKREQFFDFDGPEGGHADALNAEFESKKKAEPKPAAKADSKSQAQPKAERQPGEEG